MDPTRWHEVKAVFAEAAEMAQEARPAFLASRCREDPALLAEVQSLFDAEDSGSGEMSAAIGREARFVAESIDAGRMASSTKPGARFGAYRVIRELGRGGMGSVYLAVRSDDEFQREVAIKVVRTLTPALLDRFRDERQILADLNHPGIARLLDGATTPEGLPYLVMEYIDGRPIDRDCDEKRLSVKDRLRLFLKVCEAVEFAHRNLVIHRDLKPSNILVSAEGEPKLLDFGIAKLLDAPGGRMDREATQTGVHLMTPDYASPEQVRGGPITTATDVYALGLLLYRLLVGQPPYVARDQSLAGLQLAILETPPESPSRRLLTSRSGADGRLAASEADGVAALRGTTDERLRRELSGDLDQIVLMALRKEPERRYSSVSLFAQDIRHFLDGKPVSARPDTWRYRTGKLLRRHWLAASFAALFMLTVTLLSAALFVQVQRVSRQRDIATKETRKAEETVRFFLNLFRLADPGETRGNAITAREVLDQGSQRVRRELRDQPELQGEMMVAIAEVYQNLGLYQRADGLLQNALEIQSKRLGTRSREYLKTLLQLGLVRMNEGRYEEARPLLRNGLDTAREVGGAESAIYANALLLSARLDGLELRVDDAIRIYPECVELHRKLYGEDSLELALALNDYGLALYEKKDYKGAEKIQRQALALRQARLDLYHPDVSESLNNLAIVLTDSGQFSEAEPIALQVLEVDRKIYGERHPYIGTDLNNLAMLYQFRGDFAKAESIHREALAVRAEAVGQQHPEYGISLSNISKAQLGLKKFAEAEQSQRAAIVVFEKVYGPRNPRVAASYNMLGSIYASQERLGDARRAFEEALRLYEGMQQHHTTTKAETLLGLGRVRLRQGEAAVAEALLRQALELASGYLDEGHWRLGWMKTVLADALARQGKWGDTKALVAEAEPLLIKVRGEDGVELRTIRRLKAEIAAADFRR